MNILNRQSNREFRGPEEDLETLVDLLKFWASAHPERVAYTYLLDGESKELRLTFRDLDEKARRYAALLQKNSQPGDRVLIQVPPGLDFIISVLGCLYAGLVVVLAFPPAPNRPLTSQQIVAEDSQASLAISSRFLYNLVKDQIAQNPGLSPLKWLMTEDLESASSEDYHEIAPQKDALAFLSYTSGSTSQPKGVMISQNNLVASLQIVSKEFQLGAETVAVSWVPLHHIGGLASCLFPLYPGFQMVMMPTNAFLEKPIRWLRAIQKYQANLSYGFSFAYLLCLQNISKEECEGLDISCWTIAATGGEHVEMGVLKQFADKFSPYGFRWEIFRPAYALSETCGNGTAISGPHGLLYLRVKRSALKERRVEVTELDDPQGVTFMGCGSWWPTKRFAIVDPETRVECDADQVGEIWISSPSIALGYWQKPEATEETFHAHLANGDGPFLRTGDLGFIRENELFVTGRLKDLIIIHGRNYYPQDFEKTVERCHPALQPGGGAVFSVFKDNEEKLVVMHEIRRDIADPNIDEISQAVRRAIATEQEQPVYAVILVKAGSLPRTASGKIQRFKCREEFLAITEK